MRYGLLNDIRLLDKQFLKQTVQRYVAHAYYRNPSTAPEILLPRLMADTGNQAKLLAHFGLKITKKRSMHDTGC